MFVVLAGVIMVNQNNNNKMSHIENDLEKSLTEKSKLAKWVNDYYYY